MPETLPRAVAAETMDGALSSAENSTPDLPTMSPVTSSNMSPALSPTSTAVESDANMVHLSGIGSYSYGYSEKKRLLRAKASAYVTRMAARTDTLRTNYKAVLWSLLFMLPVILVGYSQNLVVSLLAQPQFQERFSAQEDDFGAVWMLAVQMCSVGSSMLGGMTVGWLSSQYSVRLIMAVSLVCFLGCSFINFLAPSMLFILMGTLLQGLCCGGFGTLASTYITDVCTPSISHVMTGMISCCWVLGQLSSYGVLWLTVNVEGSRAYQIPMALQWVIPVPIVAACALAPSSPWWHVRRGNTSEALHALRRLTWSPQRRPRTLFGGAGSPADPAVLRLAEIERVVALEREQETEDISFRECFRRANLCRTEIAVMINVGQIVVGFAIACQLVNFMRLAGLQSSDSIKMAFFNAIILLLGSLCYFVFYARFSTRTLYVAGLACIWPVLAMIGTLEVLKRTGIGQAALLFGWSFLYGATVGPSTNTIVCNVSSAALRTKTLAFSRMANDMANLVQAAAGPYMLGQDKANMQGLTAFPAVGLISIWLVWTLVRLPEMKGIPQAIMDILFERRVPARRFQREAKRLQIMDAQALDGQVDGARDVVGAILAADVEAAGLEEATREGVVAEAAEVEYFVV
ncbi:hypothetical protein SCUCBS95973_005748 [Sporothrix curviconia]|uniref:Major facilitator superfamily (MFS) profile domain-containing protein n=1 Tax=Sporothrix curviconia TaxID=1260050 RepID=A0ABP0C1P7_9PEZI